MEFVSKDVLDLIVSRLKQRVWYRHGIYRTIFLWSFELISFLDEKEFAKEGISKGLDNAIQIKGEFFIVQEDFDEFCRLYDEKLIDGIRYLRNYIDSYNRDMDKVLRDTKAMGSVDASSISNKVLGDLFLRHFESILPLHHWLWSMEFLNESFDKKLRSMVHRNFPKWSSIEIDTFLGSASFTLRKQFFQKEEEDILSLNGLDDPRFNTVFEEYRWLKMHFIDETPFSVQEYRERASDILSRREEIVKKMKQSREDSDNATKIINDIEDPELRGYLLLMQELSFLKTYRIDVYTRSFYNVIGITKEIVRRLGVTFDELLHHTKAEVVSALDGKSLTASEIASRLEWCVLKVDGKTQLFKGDKALNSIRKAIEGEAVKPQVIVGTVAYPGVVRGKVRVSFSSKDIHKVEQGEILVCNLTNPDYNPVFKKLAGIITDEGGVLCHSAIMAREFRIPCIIGTKIATKVLKDGDMVEVDADKGVVRVI